MVLHRTEPDEGGERQFATPKYAFWNIDYFRLVILGKQKTREVLFFTSYLNPQMNLRQKTCSIQEGAITMENYSLI